MPTQEELDGRAEQIDMITLIDCNGELERVPNCNYCHRVLPLDGMACDSLDDAKKCGHYEQCRKHLKVIK